MLLFVVLIVYLAHSVFLSVKNYTSVILQGMPLLVKEKCVRA